MDNMPLDLDISELLPMDIHEWDNLRNTPLPYCFSDEEFEKEIAPFFWVEHEESASACLNVGEYLQEIFNTREDEGFEGNGYDWGSLAQVFLDEQCSNLQGKIGFDPEGSMFCVYSKDKNALAEFILRFKKACEDKPFILDLFSRAELD